MSTFGILKLVLNIVGAASAGYFSTGTWEGAAAAAGASLVALLQNPPWKKEE